VRDAFPDAVLEALRGGQPLVGDDRSRAGGDERQRTLDGANPDENGAQREQRPERDVRGAFHGRDSKGLDPVEDREARVRLEAGGSEQRNTDVAGEERVTADAELGSSPLSL